MSDTLRIFKIGGQVIDDRAELEAFLKDFAGIPGKKLLVHGGGKWVSDLSRKLGIEVKLVSGRRITNDDTIDVVKMVLPGLANKTIVALLQKYGVNALGLTGADGNLILAKKRPVKDGIDYGWVGDVVHVDTAKIGLILENGFIPVFTAMTHNGKGQMLNTNADTIASVLATHLSSLFNIELFFCFEKPGVLENEEDDASVISHIDSENYRRLKDEGVIHSGMLPKIENAFDALKKGVKRVHICNYRDLHKLSRGNKTFGTIIS